MINMIRNIALILIGIASLVMLIVSFVLLYLVVWSLLEEE